MLSLISLSYLSRPDTHEPPAPLQLGVSPSYRPQGPSCRGQAKELPPRSLPIFSFSGLLLGELEEVAADEVAVFAGDVLELAVVETVFRNAALGRAHLPRSSRVSRLKSYPPHRLWPTEPFLVLPRQTNRSRRRKSSFSLACFKASASPKNPLRNRRSTAAPRRRATKLNSFQPPVCGSFGVHARLQTELPTPRCLRPSLMGPPTTRR